MADTTVRFSSLEKLNLYLALCEDGRQGGDGYFIAADLLREEGYDNAADLMLEMHRCVKGIPSTLDDAINKVAYEGC